MFAIFGRMLPKQFATYDPATSSWRMSGATYLWDSGTYSGIWPASGMTRSGVSYELPPPAHLTEENESSSLLKTPTANLGTNGGSQHPDKRKAGGHGPTLADEVEHLLPTPVASEGTKATNRQNAAQKALTGQVWLTNVAHTIAQSGASTAPPSAAGSGSPGAQLPGQLSLLDVMVESA